MRKAWIALTAIAYVVPAFSQAPVPRGQAVTREQLFDDKQLEQSLFEIEEMQSLELQALANLILDCRKDDLRGEEERYKACARAYAYYEIVGKALTVSKLLMGADLHWSAARVERLYNRQPDREMVKTLFRIESVLAAWKASVSLRFTRLSERRP